MRFKVYSSIDYMKVCRFTGETFPTFDKISSGLAPNYYYLCKNLENLGCKNTLIAGGYPQYLKEEIIDKFKVIRIKNTTINQSLTGVQLNYLAWKEIKKLDFDLLHIHNPFGIWIQKFMKQKINVPIVISLHGCISWNFNEEFIPLRISLTRHIIDRIDSKKSIFSFKMAAKYADAIIGVSNAVGKDLISYFGINKNKIFTVHNGFSPDLFKPKKFKKTCESTYNLLYVGSFVPRKGLNYLLKSLSLLKDIDLKMTFIGTSKLPYLRWFNHLIYKYNLQKKIRCIGTVPHKDLVEYYQNSDLFIFPSLSDAFGKVILESMACGCPVLATSAGGIEEVIGDSGLIVPPKNSDVLASEIKRLLLDEKLRYKLSRKSIQRSKKFTWEKAAKDYLNIYKSLVK